MSYDNYIINDKVIFKVNESILEPLSENGERVMLNAPTARCLQLLLESDGSIVSRDEFLKKVWETRGIVVSENTFYQNISLLRKSLKTAGLEKDIIITVRRQGFSLATETFIVPVPNDSGVVNTYDLSIDSINAGSNPIIERKLLPAPIMKALKEQRVIVYGLPSWVIWLIIMLIIVEIVSLVIRHFV